MQHNVRAGMHQGARATNGDHQGGDALHLQHLHHGVWGVCATQLQLLQPVREMPNGGMPRRTDPAYEVGVPGRGWPNLRICWDPHEENVAPRPTLRTNIYGVLQRCWAGDVGGGEERGLQTHHQTQVRHGDEDSAERDRLQRVPCAHRGRLRNKTHIPPGDENHEKMQPCNQGDLQRKAKEDLWDSTTVDLWRTLVTDNVTSCIWPDLLN